MFNALDYFFPNPEFIAFEPIFIPNLAKFPSILPPVSAFLRFPWFLYFLTILLATVCVADGTTLLFSSYLPVSQSSCPCPSYCYV